MGDLTTFIHLDSVLNETGKMAPQISFGVMHVCYVICIATEKAEVGCQLMSADMNDTPYHTH